MDGAGEYLQQHLQRVLGRKAVWSRLNSFYDIGIDWVAPYNSTTYTIGIVFLRCVDVSNGDQCKSWNTVVIGIIPGPNQPERLSPYLEPLVAELERLGLHGMTVTETYTDADGNKQSQTFRHRVFLRCVLCDTPARSKVGAHVGHGSKYGACPWAVGPRPGAAGAGAAAGGGDGGVCGDGEDGEDEDDDGGGGGGGRAAPAPGPGNQQKRAATTVRYYGYSQGVPQTW